MSSSKKHHWWPICVSHFWKGADGRVTRLSPNGGSLRQNPKEFGVIKYGHSIRLSHNPNERTVWDYNFEDEFQRADDSFPHVIRWLEGLKREDRTDTLDLTKRFLPQEIPEEWLERLMEGLVSLCVRSPMNRNASVRLAQSVRNAAIKVREKDAITALNMRYQQRMIADALGTHGKFVVIYSPRREFIFGDGFFHNLTSPAAPPIHPEMMVPLTPNINVLFVRPIQYSIEPRLSTLVVGSEEAEVLNHTVQIYAKEMIFYRSEQPDLTQEFRKGEHYQYSGPNNPIANFVHLIPGVPPENTSFDFLFQR
jgi:hypothetical protein